MVFTLTIAGASKLLLAGSLNIRQIANGRHTAAFQLDSEDRSYRPAIDAEVVMEEDGTRVFGGLIDSPAEAGMFGGLRPGIRTTLNAVDFNLYTEWRYVNETFPAQTLKARLQALIANYLTDYGITLHASQVDGPTLPSVSYNYIRMDTVLNEQMTLTADSGQPFVWRINYSKVLRAYQPSTQAAPFNLSGDTLTQVRGDIEVIPSNDGKANRVVVKVAPKQETGRVEAFTGDGVTTTYTLEYTLTAFPYGLIHVFELDGVTPAGGETFGYVGTSPVQWEYDPDTNQIERTAGATDATKIYKLTFDGFFAGEWIATDATWTSTPTSRRMKVITLESIPDSTTGQAFADSELAKSLTGPTVVKYTTWEQALEPGQSQLINVPSRNVNDTGVITEIIIRDLVHRLERQVTVIVDDAQTNLDRTWGDVYKIWAGDKTAAPVVPEVGDGGAVSMGASPPLTSVQFNRNGGFGGDASFTYNETTNSVTHGLDSSITAANHESCDCGGRDCHIADP